MFNCRVQGCIDNETYSALMEYMKTNDIDKVSTAVRKLLRKSLLNDAGERNKL